MFNTIRYLLLPVLNASGPVFIWLAAALLIPFTLSVSKQDGAADSFLTCFLITLATGVVLMLLTRRWRRELTSRHGFLLVTLIWTSVPLFGTIPFIIERPDMSFAQLYFEMMSCLTTTGATVFTMAKFTIPDDKCLVVELNEKNGGRHQSFVIENEDLVRAGTINELQVR